jgi:hypothetical protein
MMNHVGEVIRSRLGDLARRHHVNTEVMLTRWVNERFLSRLAASSYHDWLALKGATLFVVWDGDLIRATTDLDLHGLDETHSGRMLGIIEDVLNAETNEPDGIEFRPTGARAQRLVGGAVAGDRVVVPLRLGTAVLRLKIDTGFGHAVTPGFERRWYPSLLPDYHSSEILCYPRETVIAEKLAVAVEFGRDNTRLRDTYDLWVLSQRYFFRGHLLLLAIERTFARRDAGSFLSRRDGYWEAAFGPSYATAPNEKIWQNWLASHAPILTPPSFKEVVERVGVFALPLLRAARDGGRSPGYWIPDQGWQ